MSDELIEAMAREIIYSFDMDPDVFIGINGDKAMQPYRDTARALIPIIRAHLEPTSEMVEEGIKSLDAYFDEIDECSREYTQDAVIETFEDMLAASPIGDVG